MAAAKQELDRFLVKQYEEKVLDTQFEQLQRIQEADNPGFVTEMLELFIGEVENQILQNIDPNKLDFLINPRVESRSHQKARDDQRKRVEAYVHRLKGSSVSVGSYRVTLACNEFRHAGEQNDIVGYQNALIKIKEEFVRVKNVFNTIIQLERNINNPSSAPYHQG